ncbi:hypothetical protein Q4489_15135 [Thalassotalea sp. 1_MG-2023]|uniref:hypothetical protein n=1 Tax=Thalassotalea sp. 1_MG-2023 TaxID=3062680 RepID=UPI0026E1365E|nr:hypothetical protein [Thalassotalea sp. 1_MG-2023]MDO6428349.1 hypothetical protein [Thalassotalea sp. 1_MG-2023]
MELIIIIAVAVLCWMSWQLWRAKQFTAFKGFLFSDIKPLVAANIEQQLVEQRSNIYPNNAIHIQAATEYWTKHASRILQYALAEELITEQQLKQQGRYRFCQHLFHIEANHMHVYQMSSEEPTNGKS